MLKNKQKFKSDKNLIKYHVKTPYGISLCFQGYSYNQIIAQLYQKIDELDDVESKERYRQEIAHINTQYINGGENGK